MSNEEHGIIIEIKFEKIFAQLAFFFFIIIFYFNLNGFLLLLMLQIFKSGLRKGLYLLLEIHFFLNVLVLCFLIKF